MPKPLPITSLPGPIRVQVLDLQEQGLSNEEIIEVFFRTLDEFTTDKERLAGLINIANAMAHLLDISQTDHAFLGLIVAHYSVNILKLTDLVAILQGMNN